MAQETLGQLIKRRMEDLKIPSVAAFGRLIGCSRSYACNLVNDKSSAKSRDRYVPDSSLVKRIAAILQVPETEVLQTIDYLSPVDMNSAAYSFFGGGKNLSPRDWENIFQVTRKMIDQREKEIEFEEKEKKLSTKESKIK